jgi:hypothetical protein
MNAPLGSAIEVRETAALKAAVVDSVSTHYYVAPAQIMRSSRNVALVWARHVAIALTVEYAQTAISIVAGAWQLDRATITNATRRITKIAAENQRVASGLSAIRSDIEGHCPELKNRNESALARRERLMASRPDMSAAVAELELDAFLRDLRRGLASAIQLDPGAVLAGIKRTVDTINAREGRQ